MATIYTHRQRYNSNLYGIQLSNELTLAQQQDNTESF